MVFRKDKMMKTTNQNSVNYVDIAREPVRMSTDPFERTTFRKAVRDNAKIFKSKVREVYKTVYGSRSSDRQKKDQNEDRISRSMDGKRPQMSRRNSNSEPVDITTS